MKHIFSGVAQTIKRCMTQNDRLVCGMVAISTLAALQNSKTITYLVRLQNLY